MRVTSILCSRKARKRACYSRWVLSCQLRTQRWFSGVRIMAELREVCLRRLTTGWADVVMSWVHPVELCSALRLRRVQPWIFLRICLILNCFSALFKVVNESYTCNIYAVSVSRILNIKHEGKHVARKCQARAENILTPRIVLSYCCCCVTEKSPPNTNAHQSWVKRPEDEVKEARRDSS